MSKASKIAVAFMLCCIFIYLLEMFLNNKNNSNDIDSNATMESGDFTNEIKNAKYTIDSGENTIEISAETSKEITTTKYYFENDKVSKIEIIEKVFDENEVQGIYDIIVSDETISKIYSNIEIDGNTIKLTLKDEYIENQKETTKENIYDEFKKFAESNNEL